VRVDVLNIGMGDVVKYGIWRQVVSVKQEHFTDCNVTYKTLYFEDESSETFNVTETLEMC